MCEIQSYTLNIGTRVPAVSWIWKSEQCWRRLCNRFLHQNCWLQLFYLVFTHHDCCGLQKTAKLAIREFTVATASLPLYGWKKMVNSVVAFGVFHAALVSWVPFFFRGAFWEIMKLRLKGSVHRFQRNPTLQNTKAVIFPPWTEQRLYKSGRVVSTK